MNPMFAFVLLREFQRPPLEKVFQSLEENWDMTEAVVLQPTLPADADLPPFDAFRIEEVDVLILAENETLEAEDVEESCRLAWYWPNALQEIAGYQAHLTVVLPHPPQNPVERAAILTQVTAAVADASQAVAVIWPQAGLIHRAADFLNSARQMGPGQYPLELWIGFHGEREDDETLTFFTRGMRSFSLPEIEVYRTSKDPQFVYERVFNIAHYLIENGPVIHDGETVGMSEDEQYEVKIGPSQLEPTIRALQVQM